MLVVYGNMLHEEDLVKFKPKGILVISLWNSLTGTLNFLSEIFAQETSGVPHTHVSPKSFLLESIFEESMQS